MSPARAIIVVAITMAFLLGLVCAPPPKEIDYNEPDAGEHPDAPILLSMSPDDGEENVNRKAIFKLKFDRHIDAKTLFAHRFKLQSGEASRSLLTVYDPTQKEILVWLAGQMLPETTWVFSIRPGLMGLNNAPVPQRDEAAFRTGKDVIIETPFKNRSYQDEVVPIFEKHCSSCHGGAGKGMANLKLDTKENILATAISVPATGRQEWKRVAPTSPGESYLLYKLTSDELITGLRMPRTLSSGKSPAPLSRDEKQILFDWIATGAHFVDP